MKTVAFVAAALALAAPIGLVSPAAAQEAPAAAPAPAPAPPAAAPAPAPAAPAAPLPCTPVRGLNFVCGLPNVEDMIPVDGGKALVAGSYKEGSAGLFLIDTATKTAKPVALTVAAKPDAIYGCAAPDLTKLSTHGLDVRGRGPNVTVYAVAHGQRESIEVFRLDARKGAAEWVGCVLAPAGVSVNSVASAPDGSIFFTKFADINDKNPIQTIQSGQKNGAVYRWTPGKGVSEVPGTQFAGDNGLLVSPDGKTIYVNAYGTREIWKIPLSGKAQPVAAKVEFSPDNLRWGPEGTILVTGQFLKAGAPGPSDWAVARLDPETMKGHEVLSAPGMPEFGSATTGVVAGNLIWLGTFRGDRVAYMPAP